MHSTFLKLYVKFHNLTTGEHGQDLVEYALLCSLIAVTLIASISHLASAVTHAFNNISSSLA